MMEIRHCKFCGEEFTPNHPKQKFCDSICRVKYHRLPQQIESIENEIKSLIIQLDDIDARYTDRGNHTLDTFQHISQWIKSAYQRGNNRRKNTAT